MNLVSLVSQGEHAEFHLQTLAKRFLFSITVQESEAVKIVGSQRCGQGDPGLCAGDALFL